MKKISTQVCIVGAGPGGTATAMFLAKAGIESVLVDKAKFPRDKICGDALSGKAVAALRRIDPQMLDRLVLSPIQVDSWGVQFVAPNRKALNLPFKPGFDKAKDQSPGFISKRLDFDNFLVEQARTFPRITFIDNVFLKHFETGSNSIVATDAKNNIQIESQLIIGADGPYSAVAKHFTSAEVPENEKAYGIRAYYENVEGMDTDNFIELHFLKKLLPGYFWIFPLPNNMANVGLGIRADVVKRRDLDLKRLLQELLTEDEILTQRFKNATLKGPVKLFPLPLGMRQKPVSGNRFMLVGDAAQLVDPFTGEGIGNAMFSGMHAAEVAEACIAANDFSHEMMQTYDQKVWRRFGSELKLSRRMQTLVNYPWLFNFVVNKANSNRTIRETISCMFNDLDIRAKLKQPSFYLKLLFD